MQEIAMKKAVTVVRFIFHSLLELVDVVVTIVGSVAVSLHQIAHWID